LKKRTKKLLFISVRAAAPRIQSGKSFWALFFKKERLLSLGEDTFESINYFRHGNVGRMRGRDQAASGGYAGQRAVR
jgi:hypothetical protein